MQAERVWILIFRLMWTQLWARHNIYDELRQPLHGELSHSPCYLKLSRAEPNAFCWSSLQRIHRATSQPTVDKYAALWDLDRRRTKVSSSCIRLSRLQVHGPICTHVPSCCIPNAIYSNFNLNLLNGFSHGFASAMGKWLHWGGAAQPPPLRPTAVRP